MVLHADGATLSADQQQWWGQLEYAVRFGWGPLEAAALTAPSGALVVVDVLSFTTSVCVAVARGIEVYPADPADDVEALARRHDAVLAVRRREVDAEHPFSLSPRDVAAAPYVPRLLLPSPNGSRIAIRAIAGGQVEHVVAGSLRNSDAIVRSLLERGYGTLDRPITVVAAGERWPDGSLRPAIEDALGAGGVVAGLRASGAVDLTLVSPEATYVAQAFAHTDVAQEVRAAASARELIAAGYAADVDIAVEREPLPVVPSLHSGRFTA